jgi:hypothetical protein
VAPADDTLELSILDAGFPQQVVSLARCASDTAVATIPCGQTLPALVNFGRRIAGALAGQSARPTSDELRRFGELLHNFLVQGDVAQLYARLPASHVRIHVITNRPEVKSIPWEFMQEPTQPSGPRRQRSIVRVVPTIGFAPPRPRRTRARIRVLFAVADPIDRQQLDWSEAKLVIERAFARVPEACQLDFIEGASPTSLMTAITRGRYDVFHFMGHGGLVKGRGQLTLTNGRDRSSQLDVEQLVTMLRDVDIRLVILSACDTAAGNFEHPFDVIAESLLRGGIPAVVASQMPLPNSTVATFAEGMYDELLRSGDVDVAVAEGRVRLAVCLAGASGSILEWGVPVLYRHVRSAKVFQ